MAILSSRCSRSRLPSPRASPPRSAVSSGSRVRRSSASSSRASSFASPLKQRKLSATCNTRCRVGRGHSGLRQHKFLHKSWRLVKGFQRGRHAVESARGGARFKCCDRHCFMRRVCGSSEVNTGRGSRASLTTYWPSHAHTPPGSSPARPLQIVTHPRPTPTHTSHMVTHLPPPAHTPPTLIPSAHTPCSTNPTHLTTDHDLPPPTPHTPGSTPTRPYPHPHPPTHPTPAHTPHDLLHPCHTHTW